MLEPRTRLAGSRRPILVPVRLDASNGAQQFRCQRPSGCRDPQCGRPLLTVVDGVTSSPMRLARECPLKKGLMLEFDVIPTNAAERAA